MDDFLELVAEEFEARSKQIRRVIGSHGPSIGSGHEVLMRNFLERYLPDFASVGQGMIKEERGNISGQIDVLIYNSSLYGPLYKVDDFVILPPESVFATIEVKTKLDDNSFNRSASQLIENKKISDDIVAGMFIFHPPKEETISSYILGSELSSTKDSNIPDVFCGLGEYYLEKANMVLEEEGREKRGVGFLKEGKRVSSSQERDPFSAFFYRIYSHLEKRIDKSLSEGIDRTWEISENESTKVPGRRRFSKGPQEIDWSVFVKEKS